MFRSPCVAVRFFVRGVLPSVLAAGLAACSSGGSTSGGGLAVPDVASGEDALSFPDAPSGGDVVAVVDAGVPDVGALDVPPGQKDAGGGDVVPDVAPVDVPGADAGPDAADAGPSLWAPWVGGVVITEIMKNPQAVPDTFGEWIELLNVRDEPISLKGWILRDDGLDHHVITGDVVLEPGAYAVLAVNGDPTDNGGVEDVAWTYPPQEFLLGNGADQVVLAAPDGTVVDRVDYGTPDDGWPAGEGAALSLRPGAEDAQANDDPANWCDAPLAWGSGTDRGSPGGANPDCEAQPETQCDDGIDDDGDGLTDCDDFDCEGTLACSPVKPGDLVITEIMANPVALDDVSGEWFEVLNAADHALDLDGLVVETGSGQSWGVPALSMDAGARVVFARSAAAVPGLEGLVAWGGGISLPNKGGSLRLRFGPWILDEVVWGEAAGLPVVAGASLQVDPDHEQADANDDPGVWCESTVPYNTGDLGTPGQPNTPCPEPVCGNGVVEVGEQCDDGNDVSGDGCEPDCTATAPGCGDGVLGDGEECDDGNIVPGDGCSPVCTVETPVPAGSVLITEILANPQAVPDAVGEWIEVYNATDKPVNLDGWRVLSAPSEMHIIKEPGGLVVQPGSFVLLGASTDPATNGGFDVAHAWGTEIGLSNSGDQVALEWAGQIVDAVAWSPPDWAIPNGASLQLDPSKFDADANDSASAWCATDEVAAGAPWTPSGPNVSCPVPPQCGNGIVEAGEECDDGNDVAGDGCEPDCTPSPATCGNGIVEPGEECDDGNDVAGDGCEPDCTPTPPSFAPGTLIVTEFMANPAALADNQAEWIEVFNPTDSPVDMAGWTLRDDGSDEHVLPAGEAPVVPPGGFAVLAASPVIDPMGTLAVDYVYANFTLANGTDAIVLQDPAGNVIDRVDYGAPLLPVPEGRALQLDPEAFSDVLNDDPANWCPAEAPLAGVGPDRGTPGAANLDCALPPGCGDAQCDAGESCATCPLDCGACDPCAPRDDAGCPGCACESCVCAADPSCCEVAWDESCVVACMGCGVQCGFQCGNGLLEPGEECDEGAANSDALPDACRANCVAAHCGDGVVDTGEECDDGNTTAGDGCDASCAVEVPVLAAGDLVITEFLANPEAVSDSAGEWVELYNASAIDLDLKGAVLAGEPGEAFTFDEHVVVPAGGYAVVGASSDVAANGGVAVDAVWQGFSLKNSSDSIAVVAPDGTLVDAVDYDIGNGWPVAPGAATQLDTGVVDATANDAASAWCAATASWTPGGDAGSPGEPNPPCGEALCGNGVLEPGEQCDDGAANSDTAPDACRTNCVAAHCGDGVVDSDEACDDGNDVPLDGCEPDCTLSETVGCGDGVLQPGEECDDGNIVNGDGCSAGCTWEAQKVGAGALVIDEIMRDPVQVADADGEWFEIVNTSGEPIDLRWLLLEDASGGQHVVDPGGPLVVGPGERVVFGANADLALNGGVEVNYAYGGDIQLVNTGTGGVSISTPWGLVDAVNWDDTWPGKPGRALSLDPGALDATANDDVANWCAAKTFYNALDLGSPGQPNPACATVPECGNGLVDPTEECDDGNTVSGDGCDAQCHSELPDPPAPGEVVFNEIMVDPVDSADEHGEWIELLNVSNHPVDLNGSTLSDAQATHTINAGGPLLVEAGAVLLLARSGDSALNGGLSVDYVWSSGVALANDGDSLALHNRLGELVDAVSYGAPWPAWPYKAGYAMQLDPSAADAASNDDPGAWCLATAPYSPAGGDRGSPGAPNPPCPVVEPLAAGDLVVTELMIDPAAVADTAGEWIEVTNVSGGVRDLAGVVLTDGKSDYHLIDPGGPLLVQPGSAVVLARLADPALNGGVTAVYDYDNVVLANGADTLRLETSDGLLIDEVSWDASVGFPVVAGATAQLDPVWYDAAGNDDPAHWCAASVAFGAGDLGTPGAANPSCSQVAQ